MLKFKIEMFRFICFSLTFVLLQMFFLSADELITSSDVNVANAEKKNIDNNIEQVNSLFQKVRLLDNFIDDSNWASYGELLKDDHYQKKGSINLIIAIYPLPNPQLSELPKGQKFLNYKEVIPYIILFANQINLLEEDNANDEEVYEMPITQPTIEMTFWKNDNNNNKKGISSYSEHTPIFWAETLFYKNTNPSLFNLHLYNEKLGRYDYDNTTEIDWDTNGKITSQKKLEQIQKLPRQITKLQPPIIKQRQLPTVNLDAIKDQKVLKTLNTAKKICDLKNVRELIDSLKSFPLSDKDDKTVAAIKLVNNELHSITIFKMTSWTKDIDGNDIRPYLIGYYLSFKNNKLRIYAEGDLSDAVMGYYDANAKDNTKRDNLSIDGKGIEVKFYSNGVPASYKSIVRNRLYGRQIGWNEKGEVISDVDLDIPKEWKDAPKKSNKSIKK
jgi:hypothetical protein